MITPSKIDKLKPKMRMPIRANSELLKKIGIDMDKLVFFQSDRRAGSKVNESYLPERELPNGVKNVGTLQFVGEHTIVTTDITSIITSYDNVDYIRIAKPIGSTSYGNYGVNLGCMSYFELVNPMDYGNTYHNVAMIGKVALTPEIDYFWIGIPKGSMTLQDAKDQYVGLTYYYQLATPISTAKGPTTSARRASDGETVDISFRRGTPKAIEKHNEWFNGDGRYGEDYTHSDYGTKELIPNGIKTTGTGSSIYLDLRLHNYAAVFGSSYQRKYFFKMLVKADSVMGLNIDSYNGTNYPGVNITDELVEGEFVWVTGIINQGDVVGEVRLRCLATYADTATQNGKSVEIKYWSIIDMGDSSSDPLYDKTEAEMEQWLSEQPNAVQVEGGYYLKPYGLNPGEMNLDEIVAFGGTDSLQYAEIEGQQALGKNLFNKDSATPNFSVNVSDGTLAGGFGRFASDFIYIKGLNNISISNKGLVSSARGLAFYDKSKVFISGVPYQSPNDANNVTVSIPSNAYYIRFSVMETGDVDMAQLEEGTTPTTYEEFKRKDSWQETASYQPLLYDNGLVYPGLGKFDGVGDYFNADLPNIVNGPCTWWCKVNVKSGASYPQVFSINGEDHTQFQYGVFYYHTAQRWDFRFNGTLALTIDGPVDEDLLLAFSWDGSVIVPYAITENGIVTNGGYSFSGSLPEYPNKFIGCRSASADATVKAWYFDGEIMEIGIVEQALTQEQIEALW